MSYIRGNLNSRDVRKLFEEYSAVYEGLLHNQNFYYRYSTIVMGFSIFFVEKYLVSRAILDLRGSRCETEYTRCRLGRGRGHGYVQGFTYLFTGRTAGVKRHIGHITGQSICEPVGVWWCYMARLKLLPVKRANKVMSPGTVYRR